MSTRHEDAYPHKKQESKKLSDLLEPLKTDMKTIRIILLTAVAVVLLISPLLLFLLKNFVTYDVWDRYLHLTEGVRPKILHEIPAELNTGYSKTFIFRSDLSGSTMDNSMVFYATKDQRVFLKAWVTSIEGTFQPVKFQVNGTCVFGLEPEQPPIIDHEITKNIREECPDREATNLHLLKVILPAGVNKSSTLQVTCLILISQPIHNEGRSK